MSPRYLHVVELVENDKTEISLADARKRNPPTPRSATSSPRPCPPVDFNRINAQNAKQVIVQKVRDAERERQYDEYKDRIGEVVHGVSSAPSSARWWWTWARPKALSAATR